MVRKLRAQGVTEIAVMEFAQVGVRARARVEATATATSSTLAKRRKLNSGEVNNFSSYIQLRSRTINTGIITVSSSESSPGLEIIDHDHASISCCSSHGSSERIEFVDLKDKSVDVEVEVEASTYSGCIERRETTSSSKFQAEEESDDVDSTMKHMTSSERNSSRRLTADKIPTDSEIEDFFAGAEKKLVKQFEEKYNFDLVKEKPKEGKYEWIRLEA